MKKLYTILILFFVSNFVFGQNPLVKQWDYRFGGTNNDYLYTMQETSDGGFILGGATGSNIGGDKTQANWGWWDYWIVKIDSLGIKQWDRDFGGTADDLLYAVRQTADGGYILGGWSNSGISGDKTQSNWGGGDYWIIKTDSLGIKQWDKRFGGTDYDQFNALELTADGGSILAGYSFSGISGDKTQPTWGVTYPDFWIVKIDSAGNKQWDKDFGGTELDKPYSVMQTADGGYLAGGFSQSNISGDKTQPLWGFFPGDADCWIVKMDSSGNKEWDKDFGGTQGDGVYSMKQTADHGYLFEATSASGISGNKTEPNWDTLNYTEDFWIIKTDSLGNIQWDKDYGGTDNEWGYYGNIAVTSDGGYLISGTSKSPVSGNKTEPNLSGEQSWMLKADSAGNVQWDKTLRTNTNSFDQPGCAIQAKDGCYVTANATRGGIAGDKTQPAWNGSEDYWIVKFCDSTSTTGIYNLQFTNYNFQFSPNPFTSHISITFQIENPPGRKQYIYKASFLIKNVLGQTVFEKTKNQISNSNYQTNLDLGFLPNGIYLLEVFIDGERMVKKIVKE